MKATFRSCSLAISTVALALCSAPAWAKDPTPTLIPADAGEQLTRRWGYPLTIKVDPLTTGARQFSVGTEDIAPGKAIPRHRHTHSEEIVIVQSGTVVAIVGNERRTLGPGGMAYAPPSTWMTFENHGNTAATVIWIFPQTGFEEYVRATSVPAGTTPITPLSPDELSAIREKYRDHIELDGALTGYPTDIPPSSGK